jgi:hypothetical protein
MGYRAVTGNAKKPGRKFRYWLVRCWILPQIYEDFLCDIASFFALPRYPEGKPVNLLLMSDKQLFKCNPIARRKPTIQLFIRN